MYLCNHSSNHRMKKVITYGTYDLLHEGHINLLRRAKELGDYLIVGVTSDSFDKGRGKLNVRNNVLERVEAVRKTGYADQIIIEDYVGQKIDDIQRYEADVFAIGSDWEGKFDYLKEYCEVVYLPRTEGVSSSMLREELQSVYRVGVIGTGRIARRFVPETKVVSGVRVTSVLNVARKEAEDFAEQFGLSAYDDFDRFVESVDAVYIATPHHTHYDYALRSLRANRHVLCEIPMTLEAAQARELYDMAEKRGLVLLEGSKTAHCPGFMRLVALVKSGVIGEVVDVRSSLSKMVDGDFRELDPHQAGGAMTEHASLTLLPIVKLLGTEYADVNFHSKMRGGVDIFTKGIVNYPHAVATITLGIGVKTEGNLIVSGTKGYVYVPAPWWLTDYFEVRYENQTENKKYFYSYDGDGLRYEIQEFISMIVNHRLSSYRLRRRESVAIAGIIEKFRNRENWVEI